MLRLINTVDIILASIYPVPRPLQTLLLPVTVVPKARYLSRENVFRARLRLLLFVCPPFNDIHFLRTH